MLLSQRAIADELYLYSRQERDLNQRLCTRIIILEYTKWHGGFKTYCQQLTATTTPHIMTMSHRLKHFHSFLKMPYYKEQPIVIHTLLHMIFLAKNSGPPDSASVLNLPLHSVIQYTNRPGSLRRSLPSHSDPETLTAFTLIPKHQMPPQKPWRPSSDATTKNTPIQPCLLFHTQFRCTGVTFQSSRQVTLLENIDVFLNVIF